MATTKKLTKENLATVLAKVNRHTLNHNMAIAAGNEKLAMKYYWTVIGELSVLRDLELIDREQVERVEEIMYDPYRS